MQCYIFCKTWLVNFALLSSFDVCLCFSFLRSLSSLMPLIYAIAFWLFSFFFLFLILPSSALRCSVVSITTAGSFLSPCVSLLILFMRHSTLIFLAALSYCALFYLIAPFYSENTYFSPALLLLSTFHHLLYSHTHTHTQAFSHLNTCIWYFNQRMYNMKMKKIHHPDLLFSQL